MRIDPATPDVAAVFVVAVAVISSGLALLREGLAIDADVLAPAQYGPALAALVTWLVLRRRLAGLMPSAVSNCQARAHTARALAACALFAVLLWLGFAVVGGHGTFGIRGVGGMPFVAIAGIWLFGATAEEIGWRGVLQPSLGEGAAPLGRRHPHWPALVGEAPAGRGAETGAAQDSPAGSRTVRGDTAAVTRPCPPG